MKRRGYLLALVFAGACGGSMQPTAQLNTAQVQLGRATAIGAQNDPRAAMHIKMARDSIAVAKRQMATGKNHAAWHNLTRAASDAELAEVLAREDRTTRQAAAMEQRLQSVRQQ